MDSAIVNEYYSHTMIRTITQYAYERVDADQLMPGVFEVSPDMSIGRAIEGYSVAGRNIVLRAEWEGQIR